MLKQLATDSVKQSQTILVEAAINAKTDAQKESIVAPINDAVDGELPPLS